MLPQKTDTRTYVRHIHTPTQTRVTNIHFASSIRLVRNVSSLRYVDLHGNRIHLLEPWFYCGGIKAQRENKAPINLAFNNVSSFTNMMDWKAKYGARKVHFELTLNRNPVSHITGILRGWNISRITFV